MKKKRRSVCAFLIWFVGTLVFYAAAAAVFPVDTSNTLSVPDWYMFAMVLLPVSGAALFLFYTKGRNASQHGLSDSDIAREAISFGLSAGSLDVAALQRKFHISYTQASRIMRDLEERGIVSAYGGEIDRLAAEAQFPPAVRSYGLDAVDYMAGLEFEHWCADLLRRNGFHDVEVTRGSGDQGVDVLAYKDGVKYAIQCKCYASDLGNGPVQEVNAGKTIYHCHIGVVMTNRGFTPGAIQAAEATGTLLWGREQLAEMISRAKAI